MALMDTKEKGERRPEGQRPLMPKIPPMPSISKGQAPPVSEGPMVPGTKAEKQKKRILIVDDEEDYRIIMHVQLDCDYEIYSASDGGEALSVLEWMKPTIIITDQMMPVMEGDRMIAEARRRYPDLKFIIVTSNDNVTMDTLVPEGRPDKLLYKKRLPDREVLRNAVADLIKEGTQADENKI
ncbi:Regulator of RpoS [uncultured archaeon]|nr:Regulator of RpoS [uncultured archaeon]